MCTFFYYSFQSLHQAKQVVRKGQLHAVILQTLVWICSLQKQSTAIEDYQRCMATD